MNFRTEKKQKRVEQKRKYNENNYKKPEIMSLRDWVYRF